jgi:[protein-PII] uridylyltransferase
MKLLTILTTADIGRRPRRLERLEGAAAAHAVLRDRAGADRRLLGGQPRAARRDGAGRIPRRASRTGRSAELDAYIARHYPAYWLKVDLPRKSRHARFLRASEQAGHKLAINVGFDEARGVTELTILAPDHPWLLSIIAGACASAGANIVDAQIFTTTDGRALDTIAISREFDRDEDEGAAPTRIGEMIERAGRQAAAARVVARAPPRAQGRLKAFVVEPEVTINNQWSDRYTVIEVSGLDRPGLLYELTARSRSSTSTSPRPMSRPSASAPVDVFYVTDLLGAQINAPTRQAAIKRALTSVAGVNLTP